MTVSPSLFTNDSASGLAEGRAARLRGLLATVLLLTGLVNVPDGARAGTGDPASTAVSVGRSQPAEVQLTETPAVSDVSGSALAQVGKWEAEFFSHIYTGDSAASRIGRIEQLIFGAVQKGSDDVRVSHLRDALDQAESGDPSTLQRRPPLRPPSETAAPAAAPVSATSSGQPSGKNSNTSMPNANGGDQLPVRPVELSVTKKTFPTLLQPEQVIHNLSDAIRDNPKDAELMYQRAKAFIQVDKLDRALSDLSDAIEFNPNRSDFYLARAWVYHLLGNPVMADLDIKQAQFVDPKFPAKILWGQ